MQSEDAVDEAGSPVRAEAALRRSPLPSLRGRLTLRCRQPAAMPGDVTYFWRHGTMRTWTAHPSIRCQQDQTHRKTLRTYGIYKEREHGTSDSSSES